MCNSDNDKQISVKDVNFQNFRIQRKKIAVNGKELPIDIGDRIKLSENDNFGRTVMGVTVYEDGRIQYLLEWHDPSNGSFQSEALTLSELKLLSQNCRKTKQTRIGFDETGK